MFKDVCGCDNKMTDLGQASLLPMHPKRKARDGHLISLYMFRISGYEYSIIQFN